MQPRLMRSENERIIAGVRGGLGEYFAIDPVFVRLIFVITTLTAGIGLLLYPALWLAMPKARRSGGTGQPQFGADQHVGEWQESYVMHEAQMRGRSVQARPSTAVEPPRYDPITGQPLDDAPATGYTTQLPNDPNITHSAAPSFSPANRRGWRFIGFALLGIGVLALGDAVGIETEIVFPILMIGVGVLMLLRRR